MGLGNGSHSQFLIPQIPIHSQKIDSPLSPILPKLWVDMRNIRKLFIASAIVLAVLVGLVFMERYFGRGNTSFAGLQVLDILKLLFGASGIALLITGWLRSHRLVKEIEEREEKRAAFFRGESIPGNGDELSLIYNATSDGMLLLTNEEGRFKIVSANRTFLQQYNVREGLMVGKYLDEVATPESLERVVKNYGEAVRTREVVRWDAEFDLPSGRVIAELSATPVLDAKGNCLSLVVTIHDVTKRKRAEEQLALAESRFRNLVEQSLVGVYILEEGRLKYVNPHLAHIFGYTQQELIGQEPSRIIHHTEVGRVQENILARLTGQEETIHYETIGQKKSGAPVDLEIFCSGRLEMEGGAIIGTLLDISERKHAQEGLEKAMYYLNERVKELTVLNRISTILNKDHNSVDELLYEVVNQLPSAFKYPDLAAAKISLGEKQFITPNFGESVHRIYSRFSIFGGRKGMIEIVYPGMKLPPEKDPFFLEERNLVSMVAEMLSGYLFRLAEHEARKAMEQEVMNQKIQEQKRIARAILNAQEKERNKIGQELHDNVNQVLASAKIYLGLAMDRSDAELQPVVKNAQLLVSQAIDEIRVLSSSQVTPVKRIDLDFLVKSLIEKLEDSTSIKVEFDYQVEVDRIVTDDLKLNVYRIIQEQINNILKHSDASQVNLRVVLEDKRLCVSIQDNGQGFDPHLKRQGIGINNIINRVESFNGQVTIESSPGRGTTFYIIFPVDNP